MGHRALGIAAGAVLLVLAAAAPSPALVQDIVNPGLAALMGTEKRGMTPYRYFKTLLKRAHLIHLYPLTMQTGKGGPQEQTARQMLQMFDGFGFQILLFKDSCIVRHIIASDTPIYKLEKSDSLSFGLAVPCKDRKSVV